MFDFGARGYLFLVCFFLVSLRIDSADLLLNSGLEDDVHFVFKWPGSLFNLEDDLKTNSEILDIATPNAERYKCTLPAVSDEQDEVKSESGEPSLYDPSQINTASLLSNIYAKKFCSYRVSLKLSNSE